MPDTNTTESATSQYVPSWNSKGLEAAVAQACEAAPVSRVAGQWGLPPETVRRLDKRVLEHSQHYLGPQGGRGGPAPGGASRPRSPPRPDALRARPAARVCAARPEMRTSGRRHGADGPARPSLAGPGRPRRCLRPGSRRAGATGRRPRPGSPRGAGHPRPPGPLGRSRATRSRPARGRVDSPLGQTRGASPSPGPRRRNRSGRALTASPRRRRMARGQREIAVPTPGADARLHPPSGPFPGAPGCRVGVRGGGRISTARRDAVCLGYAAVVVPHSPPEGRHGARRE